MQLIAHLAGRRGDARRQARVRARRARRSSSRRAVRRIRSTDEQTPVWMSHGDHVESRRRVSSSRREQRQHPIAAFRHETKPDLRRAVSSRGRAHAARRRDHLELPVRRLQGASRRGRRARSSRKRSRRSASWSATSRVICGLSGGVDSSVAAALVHRAIGDQLTCIFVDTGLLRLHEREQVERTFRAHLGIKLVTGRRRGAVPAALAGVEDPEKKRTIIGHTFIDVFEEAAAERREGRRVPGAGHALSRRDRDRRHRAADRR